VADVAVAAWPAVALVGSYELLMMVIRCSQVPADRAPETEHYADHCWSRRPSCSPSNSRRTEFPRCARSALSSTSASHGHKGSGTTSRGRCKAGGKSRCVSKLRGGASSQRPRLGCSLNASDRLRAFEDSGRQGARTGTVRSGVRALSRQGGCLPHCSLMGCRTDARTAAWSFLLMRLHLARCLSRRQRGQGVDDRDLAQLFPGWVRPVSIPAEYGAFRPGVHRTRAKTTEERERHDETPVSSTAVLANIRVLRRVAER
jgi:hypothetical protein